MIHEAAVREWNLALHLFGQMGDAALLGVAFGVRHTVKFVLVNPKPVLQSQP